MAYLRLSVFVGVLVALSGCAAPKQAQFVVSGCEAAAIAWGGAAEWSPLPESVLGEGPAGSWDAVDALNPSVARWQDGWVNLYSGFDGKTWRTGVARSTDGRTWRKEPAPVIEPDAASWEADYIAANGATVAAREKLWHWYQSGPRNAARIGLSVSDDGLQWNKESAPVFKTGARGAWDETAVGDPYALACGDWFYLYYLGQDRFGVQRLGVARSADGKAWQRSHLNPILETGGAGEFDERGLGEPAVLFTADGFWMLYVGRDSAERRKLGWARSEDGVRWAKTGPVLGGDQAWNEAVVCDPEWLIVDGRPLVLFGGGDRPSPDENLHGRIGIAELIDLFGGNLRILLIEHVM